MHKTSDSKNREKRSKRGRMREAGGWGRVEAGHALLNTLRRRRTGSRST